MSTNEEDFVQHMISMTTHDYLLFLLIKVKYKFKGYEVPLYNRQSKGLPIINLLPLDKDESVNTMLIVQERKIKIYCTCTKWCY